MSCNELERLFVTGAADAARGAHAAACPQCAASARDLESVQSSTSALRPPAWSPALKELLYSVPLTTVACETADDLAARSLEGELEAADRQRLEFHLSRCEACAEAAATLDAGRRLAPPQPAPWFTGRVAAAAPRGRAVSPARRRGWRFLLGPKTAIALAYAAALVLMISGFNPADLARKARTDIPLEAESVVQDARGTAVDRFGAFGERALRTALIIKSRVFGYGRAALSNAVQLVMKPEPGSAPTRPRNGEVKGSHSEQRNSSQFVASAAVAPPPQEQS